MILSETDRLVVCEAALKFSLSDRGLWDTSVSHCLLCLVFTPLRRDYTGAAALDETSRDNRDGGIKAGVTKNVRMEPERDEERERERRDEGTDEAFIKLALSQHRTIIAE